MWRYIEIDTTGMHQKELLDAMDRADKIRFQKTDTRGIFHLHLFKKKERGE